MTSRNLQLVVSRRYNLPACGLVSLAATTTLFAKHDGAAKSAKLEEDPKRLESRFETADNREAS